MKKYFIRLGLFSATLLIFVLVFTSCKNKEWYKDNRSETPTKGNIRVFCDESFKLLIDAEVYTFQSLYQSARVTPVYKPEADIITDFLNDSVKLIIVSRKLTAEEEALLKSQDLRIRTTKIASDAVAIITNRGNSDSLIGYHQLEDLFTGKTKQWKQIFPESKLGDIAVVFDNNKSGNFRYINEKFMKGRSIPSYCYAMNSNEEVFSYVQKNKNALGIIGLNWISDPKDTLSNRFLRDVRVMAVGTEGDVKGAGWFRKPYQYYIAEGTYPLSREVFAISRESFAGLGTGFASFIAGDVGQRIIERSGLVPATEVTRLVKIKKDFEP